MSILTYSHTLVAGTPEDVNDVQDMFNDVRTLVNGNLDATNLATSAKPVTLLGAYEQVGPECGGIINNGVITASFTTYFSCSATANWTGSGASPGTFDTRGIFIDVNEWNISGLTPKLRITAAIALNGTSTGQNYTFGLYPYTSSGAAGNLTTTLGTVISGSTIAINNPSTNTVTIGTGSDFTVPATGAYTIGMVTGAAPAANAMGVSNARLMLHWV